MDNIPLKAQIINHVLRNNAGGMVV